VQNQYVFWDSVHPTTGTHLIIAEYAANALNGLGGLAASAQIGAAGADAFTTQLDTRTAALAAGASGFSVDLPGQGAGQLANNGKLSGFFSGTYDFGTHKTIGADNGFTYNIASFAFGVDDQIAPGVAAGGAIGYGNDHGNITQDGSLSANAVELGGYVSFYKPAYYFNFDLAYGFDAYSTSRPGVVTGPITGHPGGNTISLGGQTGYVLNAGPLTYGPVAGLRATDASLNSYAEHGDAALTQYVDAQSYNQLIGDIGATASATLAAGRYSLRPHATITVDQLFSGNGGSFDSSFTDEPIVSLTTTYPKSNHTWATLAAGLSTSLTPRLSASLDLATTLAKSDSEDHSISVTLRAVF
jgi:outer membrane lipase/esterase